MVPTVSIELSVKGAQADRLIATLLAIENVKSVRELRPLLQRA
jgi:hypothetical protein